MIVAGYMAFVVALTFLGTVRWVRLGPDEPRAARSAPTGAPQAPSRGSRTVPDAPEPAQRRTRPRTPAWAHTQPLDLEEAA